MNKKNQSKAKNRNGSICESEQRQTKPKNKLSTLAKKLFSKIPKKTSLTNLAVKAKTSNTKIVRSSEPEVFSEKTAKSYKKTKLKKRKSKDSNVAAKAAAQNASGRSESIDGTEKDKPEISTEKATPINSEIVEKTFAKMYDEQFKGKELKTLITECWDDVEDIDVGDDKCTAFLANEDKNQAEEIECLDANRVKICRASTEAGDYIHASHVEIKNLNRKFILAQLPKMSSQLREDFWTMIHQYNVHNMYILCSPDESIRAGAERFSEYFPLSGGQHEYYGQIWVHNRKVEQLSNETEEKPNDVYIIEVLPQGCAESILVTIHLCMYWPNNTILPPMKKVVLTATSSMGGDGSSYESDPICIVSKQGAGRTGTFLTIASAINMLKMGNVPNMKEISTSIRSQRPGAIDNEPQLVFAFICVFNFASQHVANEEMKQKINNDLKTMTDYVKILKEERDRVALSQ